MNVFTHVTKQTLKKNRTRTAVTIIGIILATAMLTAVTTFISSLQDFMVKSAIEEDGNWHGAVFQIPAEKVNNIRNSEETVEVSSYQELGYAKLPEKDIQKPYLFVAGVDESFYDMLPVKLSKGRLPENSGEIVIPRHVLTAGGLSAEVGDTLTLDLGRRYIDREQLGAYNPVILTEDEQAIAEELVYRETRTYTVVGIMERPVFEDYSSAGYYCITAADKDPAEDVSFTCYYQMKSPADVYEFTEEISESGAVYNSSLLRFQGSSLNRPFMQMLYGLASILILLIMTGGVSLVYNSFAISVSDRTRQFGLLASVGATPRQLRNMVIKEALIVSAAGIPIGILSGILGIGVTLHFTGKSFHYLYSSSIPMSLHVSWPAVLAAAVTAFLTVLISAWIPSRRAAKVSPMEAIRQSKDIRVPRRVARKGKLSYKLAGLPGMLAGKHFSRSRKQYRATIFSLFISIVLFISASSFSSYVKSSVDMVNEMPGYDVAVYISGESENPQAEEKSLLESIRQIEEIDRLLAVQGGSMEAAVNQDLVLEDYLELTKQWAEDYGQQFYRSDGKLILNGRYLVLEDEDYLAYLKEIGLSPDEYMDPSAHRAIATNQERGYISEQQRYRNFSILKEPGIPVEMLLTDYKAWHEAVNGTEDGTDLPKEQFQKAVPLTVDAVAEKAPMNLYAGWGGGLCVILPQSVYYELAGAEGDYLEGCQIFIQAEEHVRVAEQIEEISMANQSGLYCLVNDVTENELTKQNMLFTVDVFTYGFIILISLIAVANVFNTISTGFLLRKREFAILSSVGMTPKSMNRMLHYECLLYGFKSLLYGLPVSGLIIWYIYRTVASSMDVGFYIPAGSIVISIFSVFVVIFATMVYARSRMKNENVIDSIRQDSL